MQTNGFKWYSVYYYFPDESIKYYFFFNHASVLDMNLPQLFNGIFQLSCHTFTRLLKLPVYSLFIQLIAKNTILNIPIMTTWSIIYVGDRNSPSDTFRFNVCIYIDYNLLLRNVTAELIFFWLYCIYVTPWMFLRILDVTLKALKQYLWFMVTSNFVFKDEYFHN